MDIFPRRMPCWIEGTRLGLGCDTARSRKVDEEMEAKKFQVMQTVCVRTTDWACVLEEKCPVALVWFVAVLYASLGFLFLITEI